MRIFSGYVQMIFIMTLKARGGEGLAVTKEEVSRDVWGVRWGFLYLDLLGNRVEPDKSAYGRGFEALGMFVRTVAIEAEEEEEEGEDGDCHDEEDGGGVAGVKRL